MAAANSQLTLEHAELLLASDPTAAVTTLAGYHGIDELRRRRLLAKAYGRGVAREVLSPHGQAITFVAPDGTGGIVSRADDQRIVVTRGGQSTTLASDATGLVAHAAAAHLIAYATLPRAEHARSREPQADPDQRAQDQRAAARVRWLAGGHSDRVAFVCGDGTAGVVRHDRAARRLVLVDQLEAGAQTQLVIDPTGRYIAILDQSPTVQFYDTVTRYGAGGGHPTFVSLPTPDLPHILIGDEAARSGCGIHRRKPRASCSTSERGCSGWRSPATPARATPTGRMPRSSAST